MDYFNELLWESHCSNTIRVLCISPRVVEIRIPNIDLFRSTPVRLVPVQYLLSLGLELLDLLDLLDLDLPRALALVFDWRDRAPGSPGRGAGAATSSTRSTTSTTGATLPLARLVLPVLIVPCDPVIL